MNDRDMWVLDALARMQFLTTRQIAMLLFEGSRAAANKRLRRLFDAALVRVWMRDISEDNVYSLTPAGAKLLAGSPERKEELIIGRVPRALDGKLDHLLAINRVRIALALTLEAVGAELSRWHSDWQLCGRAALVPDALFAVRWNDGREQTYSLEADHRTRNATRFLAKALKYRSLVHGHRTLYGQRDFIVLVVGDDRRWVERYRSSLAGLPPRVPIWFATLEDLEASGVAGPIWRATDLEEQYSLRDLTYRPYGKDRSATEIDGGTEC